MRCCHHPAAAGTLPSIHPGISAKFLIRRDNLQEVDIGNHLSRAVQAVVVGKREKVTDKISRFDFEVFKINQLAAGNAANIRLREEIHFDLVEPTTL